MVQRIRPVIVDFAIALSVTAIVALACYPLVDAIGYHTVGLLFLITISILSLFLGRAALIFTAILIFGVWNFFFIQPLYTFRVHSFHDLVALFTYLIVAIASSALINRIKKSQRTLESSQERLILLHRFLESLNDAISIKDVVRRSQEGFRENFGAELIIYLKEKNGRNLSARSFGKTELHNEDLFNRANQVFLSPAAGELAFVLNNNRIFFYYLKEPRTSIGLMGLEFPEGHPPSDEKMILLSSFIAQVGSALDREINVDLVKEKEIWSESEKLFQTVLNSVSHELKTPVAIISAAASSLNDERMTSQDTRRQIGEELESASFRLNHLVENILDMSRIESGLLKMNMQICDVGDLLGIVAGDVRQKNHDIKIVTEEDLPFISADINLLRLALNNILHNSIIYSPAGSRIVITAKRENSDLISISVLDEGPGIPPSAIRNIFDKFYRVPGTKSGGTGLGLTIAKAIAELHGGTISAGNREGTGLAVTIKLRITDGKQVQGPDH